MISLPFVVTAQTIADGWEYPNEWQFVSNTVDNYDVTTVYRDNKEGDFYKATDTIHPGISFSGNTIYYDNASNYGAPFYQVQTSILKGQFAGNNYIACLVTVKMTPNNHSEYTDKERIQSNRITVNSKITRRKSVGNLIVTYWKTETPGGETVDLGPEAADSTYAETKGGSVEISGSYNKDGAGTSITGGYNYAITKNYSELDSSCTYKKYDNKISGGEAVYRYRKPNDQPATKYKATQSTVKYIAIYKCDKNTPGNYFDIRLNVQAEFYYDRPSRIDDGILAHSSNDSFPVRF